jgi:hypothetical protein
MTIILSTLTHLIDIRRYTDLSTHKFQKDHLFVCNLYNLLRVHFNYSYHPKRNTTIYPLVWLC